MNIAKLTYACNLLCQVLYIILFTSCSKSAIEAQLSSAEMYLNEHPSLALEILNSIDKEELDSDKLKAQYSLCYSIALDKNYIDIANDSIIRPAVNYYADHGDVQTKFNCFYYEARIHENSGDIDGALLRISKAESLDTSKVDAGSLSLLYAMKSMIYNNSWRNDEAIQAGESARKYALTAGNYRHYAYYTLSTACCYMRSDDMTSCQKYLSEAEKYKSHFTLSEMHLYQDLVTCSMLNAKLPISEILTYTERYLKEFPQSEMINWRNIARVYQSCGQIDTAIEMLERHSLHYDISAEPGYHLVRSELLEATADYEGALYSLKDYVKIDNSQDLVLHQSDIRLVEDRYKGQIEILNQQHRTLIISIALLISCALSVSVFCRWKKERDKNNRELSDLQREYDVLTMMKEKLSLLNQEKQNELSKLGGAYEYLNEQITVSESEKDEILTILGHRIKSLSAFLQRPTPDSLSKVAVQIDNLKKNKNYIVDSIGILYAVNYPEFISELRQFSLTSSEIGYCCLFIMGLSMPEAGEVIGKSSSIYNINSAIRKKLNLPTSSTNLDKWLLKRFTEIYSDGIVANN